MIKYLAKMHVVMVVARIEKECK